MDPRNAFRNISIASILFALTTLGSACFGHSSSKVKDDQLGRLSAADREQLIDRERDVNVAKSNVDASKVALDEAKQFKENSHDEAKAAKEQQKQVVDDLKHAEKYDTGDAPQIQQRAQLRADQTNAMNAKSAYSDQLVELREAQVANAEAEHELMEARLSSAQYDLLRENDLAGDLDGNKFMEREGKAQQNYQKTNQQVQEKMASASASKDAWSGLQQSARAGKTGEGVESPELIEAPQPPDSLQMETAAQAKSAGAKKADGYQKQQAQKQKKSKSTSQGAKTAAPAAPQSAAPAQPAPTPAAPAQPQPAAPQTAAPPSTTPAPQPATPPQQQPAAPMQPTPSTAQP